MATKDIMHCPKQIGNTCQQLQKSHGSVERLQSSENFPRTQWCTAQKICISIANIRSTTIITIYTAQYKQTLKNCCFDCSLSLK